MVKKSVEKNAEYEVSLKVILKNKKGQILLLKMPNTSSMAEYYDLLGGRIKESEKVTSFRKIIKREIKEEVGSKIKYTLSEIPVAIGHHTYFSKIDKKEKYIFWVVFEATYQSGNVKISKEHSQYRWVNVTKNNLQNYFTRGPLEVMKHHLSGRLK